MRILIISFFTDWTTNLGIELEIAQRHLDSGDEVTFLVCDGGVKACRANPKGRRSVCERCQYKKMRGIQGLSAGAKIRYIGDYIDESSLEYVAKLASTIKTAKQAKFFQYKGHDLGWAALSSTIQELRDPVCESAEAAVYLSRFTQTAILSYEAVKEFLLQQEAFTKVYIFNGRFATTRGAFRACQEIADLDVILHERGSSNKKFALFENDLLHSKKMWERRIEDSWDSEPDISHKIGVGSSFYEERRSGTAVGWKSFTSLQKAESLPEDWDTEKTNIVIFNSSEDEFAAIGDEWENHIYSMQSEGVRRIITDSLIRYPNFRFYLRMHPNLIGVLNKDVKSLKLLSHDNIRLIEPDSAISSYALLDAADKVISFGSTMGIEATYWGKPSIMAGHSFYENLNSVYCAESHDHVMQLIGQDLAPCDKIGAIKYGYHLRTFGIDFKYWKADGFYSGFFKNIDLSAPVGILHGKLLLPFLKLDSKIMSKFIIFDKPLYIIEKFLRVTITVFKKAFRIT